MNNSSHNSNPLYKYLSKLDKAQFKAFYSMLVHYRISQNAFISRQNIFNLWCELNKLCYEVDESFPNIYDHELVKSYCHEHPYYFIDILELEPVINLFCQYLDDRLDILASIVQKLYEEDTLAAFTYANEAFGLNEDVMDRVAQIEEHVEAFS